MKRHEEDYAAVIPFIDGPLFAEPIPFAQTPTDEEARVAAIIWAHKGAANPVSIDRISAETGFSDRTVKGLVHELIVRHGLLIGARRQQPSGYFVLVSDGDFDEAIRPMMAQWAAEWRRLQVLMRPAHRAELMGQLKLTEVPCSSGE